MVRFKLFARCNENRESNVHLLHFRLILWLDIRGYFKESKANKKRTKIGGMDKVIIGAILLIQSFQTESFKTKLIDVCLTISTGMGVYFTLPFQISTNFYAQELFKSFISIFTAITILIISLFIRRWWSKRFK